MVTYPLNGMFLWNGNCCSMVLDPFYTVPGRLTLQPPVGLSLQKLSSERLALQPLSETLYSKVIRCKTYNSTSLSLQVIQCETYPSNPSSAKACTMGQRSTSIGSKVPPPSTVNSTTFTQHKHLPSFLVHDKHPYNFTTGTDSS